MKALRLVVLLVALGRMLFLWKRGSLGWHSLIYHWSCIQCMTPCFCKSSFILWALSEICLFPLVPEQRTTNLYMLCASLGTMAWGRRDRVIAKLAYTLAMPIWAWDCWIFGQRKRVFALFILAHFLVSTPSVGVVMGSFQNLDFCQLLPPSCRSSKEIMVSFKDKIVHHWDVCWSKNVVCLQGGGWMCLSTWSSPICEVCFPPI